MNFPPIYLAGDIGGTKSWMALVSISAGREWRIKYTRKYLNQDFHTIEALIATCLRDANVHAEQLSGLSLAVAGPVDDGRCRMTNLDWLIDVRTIQQHFDFCHASLINDFHAVALGVTLVDSESVIMLNDVACDRNGLKVVTGAGTGLGLAWLQRGQAQPTEGSHSGFAPADAEQQQLLVEMSGKDSFVCWEDLLSGAGLERLYRQVTRGSALPAASITSAATQGDQAALASIDLFWRIFASWAGNLALLYCPTGGIYLTGGVTNKLLPLLDREAFLSAYVDKGSMRSLVENTAVLVVTDEQVGLLGAIAHIREQIERFGEIT